MAALVRKLETAIRVYGAGRPSDHGAQFYAAQAVAGFARVLAAKTGNPEYTEIAEDFTAEMISHGKVMGW